MTETQKNIASKRVDIVSLKLIKEGSVLYKNRRIKSPADAYELFKLFLEEKDREHFIVISLNIKNEPVSINVCHIGSLNASLVSPREIMKTAILSSAASIMVAHNHPSGETAESIEDVEVTKRLAKAGELMGIKLLDHLIIADGQYNSLKEKGYV